MFEYLQSIDSELLSITREAFSTESIWLQKLIPFISDIQPIFISIFLIGLWLYGLQKNDNGPKEVALDIFWHIMGAFCIYWILNHALPIRPRPESVVNIAPLIYHIPDNSFPSGHALFFGASWWSIHKLLGWNSITILCIILGILTCSGRVIGGIHYPGDIIVGFLLGWGLADIFMRIPHGRKYRKWCHKMPLRIARLFRL